MLLLNQEPTTRSRDMAEPRPQRQLSAILAADVAGYSRLIGLDEEGTLARLKELRRTLIDPQIKEHRGRIVKTMGDGLLVQFASAVDAVRCAVDVQNKISEPDATVTDDRRIKFRVGINVGDVVVDGDDIYGEGVNVAARLEGLAELGGIWVSGAVHDQVRDKLDLAFEDMGEQRLKNIARPLRVYRVKMLAISEGTSPPPSAKPSIAVLPFLNMSGDPEQQYFSDGITEDIITELARFRPLSVVARNASFRFRGDHIDVVRAGRELGARYILEGSVRKLGNKVRITAQLIDANTGTHIWANKFDRTQEDLFAVQDQVVGTIVGTLAGRVRAVDIERAALKPPASLAAYDYVLRASALPFIDRGAIAEVRKLSERAIDLDPSYARAYAQLSISYCMEWFRDFSTSEMVINKAYELANHAVALDENDGSAYALLGWICMLRRSFDKAELLYRRSMELNPNQSDLLTGLGLLYGYMGRPDEGLAFFRQAKEIDPYFEPSSFWMEVGILHFMARRYEEAIINIKRSQNIVDAGHTYLAASYALLGQVGEARAHAAEAVRLAPELTIARFVARDPYKNKVDFDHLVDAMRKAGLPE